MTALTGEGYKLVAQSLGRALSFIIADQGYDYDVTPMAFTVAVDSIVRDFQHDNPRFDEARFRQVIAAARRSEDEATSIEGIPAVCCQEYGLCMTKCIDRKDGER